MLSDILAAVDRGEFAALVVLDLSAAFDTVDKGVLLERLRRSFGIIAHSTACIRGCLLTSLVIISVFVLAVSLPSQPHWGTRVVPGSDSVQHSKPNDDQVLYALML